jgi:hypothetical protein
VLQVDAFLRTIDLRPPEVNFGGYVTVNRGMLLSVCHLPVDLCDNHCGSFYLTNTASRPALKPIQPPIHCISGAPTQGLKRPRSEADYSPPSSTEVKNPWSSNFTPQYVFMAWCLVKHRDNFAFTLTPWNTREQIKSEGPG